MVVGLNLCPFSHTVVAQSQVRYAVATGTTDAQWKAFYVTELETLLNADETDIATSLLMFPKGLHAFDDYLDLLDWLQELLEQSDLSDHVQLASFHPRYQFDQVAEGDLSHFTNRAPYPTIHLLRQAQMSQALAHVQNPEQIFVDNIATLERLGRDHVEALCPWGKP
ncbi:MAG: DUF1415 domain-containing protein [Oceanospirillaceae bacterium]|jgi:hypothetical protein|nr:DUF1415 domain-containing protein [Oceanospirillaceae bacterium]MBT4443773.1 DUF1415 domain-containing protein [Oceanospirillaceae bacterium]MBT6076535.1 DUF1415 domain-containing protein [Oceanospirillaceae bacterium]MBT7329742.1 DUF1415 domain-containing protein [Oceanospirillaceae bacterium]